MKIHGTILLLILTIAGLASSGGADSFPWLNDLDQARVLAASEDKPLLVVFRCEP